MASDICRQLLTDVTVKESMPQFVARAIQYVDVLHPRQHIVLKVVSAITFGGIRCRWKPICTTAVHFLPRVTPDMLLHDMITLRELLLVNVDDKKEDGLCSVASAPVLEAVFETLTPMQLKSVAKKYLESMKADSVDLPLAELEDLAALAHRAGLNETCLEYLSAAWKKHSTTATGQERKYDGYLRMNDTEHRLHSKAIKFGIEPSALKHGGRSPTPLPSQPYVPKEKQLQIEFEFLKNMEPPLVIGPMCGMIQSLCMEIANNYMSSNGGRRRTHYPRVSAEMFLKFVRKFNAAVAAHSDKNTTTTMTLQDESSFVERCFKQYQTDDEALEIAQDMTTYVDEVARPRARRVTHFASSVRHVEPLEEADRETCKVLLTAFSILSHVSAATPKDDAAPKERAALMALAVDNWQSPYPYMIPAKLRDAWLMGWIDAVELKAIIFLFLLDQCGGSLDITRRATVVMI